MKNQKNMAKEKSYDVRPEQSVELLKALHILTRDGKLNQDSRRKLKQVYHLYQFIEPLLQTVLKEKNQILLVDHGAGKSYLGFILYDLFAKQLQGEQRCEIVGIETRDDLVQKSFELARSFGFTGMNFLNLSVAESTSSQSLPDKVDVVTALHACDTATDDAISFALKKKAQFLVLIPCCQAELASCLRKHKSELVKANPMSELWRHPIHTREFGSQLTNVLRCLQLESHGYKVSVTELVGWEHSMKNELIIAEYNGINNLRSTHRLQSLLETAGVMELAPRFFTPATVSQ